MKKNLEKALQNGRDQSEIRKKLMSFLQKRTKELKIESLTAENQPSQKAGWEKKDDAAFSLFTYQTLGPEGKPPCQRAVPRQM